MMYVKGENTEWYDEWIRRRNGDRYTVQPINYGINYYLNLFDEMDCDEISCTMAKFMLLHIVIDKTEYCPNDVEYNVSFYENGKISVQYHQIPSKKDRCKLYSLRELTLIKDSRLDYFKIIEIEYKKEIFIDVSELYNKLDKIDKIDKIG